MTSSATKLMMKGSARILIVAGSSRAAFIHCLPKVPYQAAPQKPGGDGRDEDREVVGAGIDHGPILPSAVPWRANRGPRRRAVK